MHRLAGISVQQIEDQNLNSQKITGVYLMKDLLLIDLSSVDTLEAYIPSLPPWKKKELNRDLNAEPNADVGFDTQASYGFVYDDSKQSNPEEGYEETPAASNVNWEIK
ncbi:hypothetical protein R6Q57_021407 [Mikania cordata]